MLQFVLSDVGFRGRIEATDKGRGKGRADSCPEEKGGGGLLIIPANLLKDVDRMNDFGETLDTL